jgi:hypothetical protein
MVQRGRSGNRLLVNGLWTAAAAIVIAGFVLRLLASVMSHAYLRGIGVALIAVGVVIAVLGWVSERVFARRAP